MQETMQYLGFDVGYGWWTPAASKAKPLMQAKVRHEDPKKGLHDHFLSVYFFSISAFPCQKITDSNTNRPESAALGRITRPHAVQRLKSQNRPLNPTLLSIFRPWNRSPAFTLSLVSVATNMSLFNFGTSRQANPTHSDNLRLQPPSTSKLATFVAAADEKSVKNDHVYYEINEGKTKAFNRKKTSLPTSARQELYNLAPWHVGLDEDDLHVSLNELTIPPQAPKFTVTLAHDPINT